MLKFIRKLFGKDSKKSEVSVPDNAFTQCPDCKTTVYAKNIKKHLGTCPECGHYFPLSSQEWVDLLCDMGSFTELFRGVRPKDTLGFPKYKDRIASLIKDQEHEAILTGKAQCNQHAFHLGIMDSKFLMASMGSVVGEKITRLVESAQKLNQPVVLIVRSGGARMQEGALSLMQMAKTSAALKKFSDAGGLFIPILTHPTTGGVSASFAMLGDIILAEPKALIGFAGPRVIEQTIKQKLPEGFQRSEFLIEKGFVDTLIERPTAKKQLSHFFALHGGKHL